MNGNEIVSIVERMIKHLGKQKETVLLGRENRAIKTY